MASRDPLVRDVAALVRVRGRIVSDAAVAAWLRRTPHRGAAPTDLADRCAAALAVRRPGPTRGAVRRNPLRPGRRGVTQCAAILAHEARGTPAPDDLFGHGAMRAPRGRRTVSACGSLVAHVRHGTRTPAAVRRVVDFVPPSARRRRKAR